MAKELMDSVELANAMVKYRAQNNLSQKEFAKLCGISSQTVNNIETGRRVGITKVTREKIRQVIDGEFYHS